MIHGITDDDVAGSPTFIAFAPVLEKFLDGCDLSGYNAIRFDIPILVEEFLRAFATSAAMNLHIVIQSGRDAHHMIEGVFKALAKALDLACQRDARVQGVPSTKGTLSR